MGSPFRANDGVKCLGETQDVGRCGAKGSRNFDSDQAMRIAGDIFNLEKGAQPMAELLQEAFGTVVWEVQSGNTRA